MQRIGIFGGSFDPVHNHHISICDRFAKLFDLDFVLIIPAKTSPFKTGVHANDGHRLQMLKIACAKNPKIKPCDIELKLEGKSYTYRTVELLREIYSDAKFYLLMGADNISGFENWKNPDNIVEQCEIVVAGRSGESVSEGLTAFEKRFNKKAHYFESQTGLSSSFIRECLKLGADCSDYLDLDVYEYIKNNGLYKGDEIYNYLNANLKPARLTHVAGVAVTAVKFAKQTGENADNAHIAGLLHDVAKYMGEKDFSDFTLPKECEGDIVPTQIVHQFLGAFVAENILNIKNPDVLNAIRWHTTGRKNMSQLEKIVFVADLLEPSRSYGEVELLRQSCAKDFEEGFRLCLKRLIVYLQSSRQPIYRLTIEANEYYNGK